MNAEKEWTISPAKSLFHTKLINLYPYRYLLCKLIQREIRSQYRQTILGPIWFLLQPILSTAVFVFSFGKVAGLSTDGIPQPLFYFSGLILWSHFTECLSKTANIFKDNIPLFSKIFFPRVLIPMATIAMLLLRFLIQLCLLTIFMFIYHYGGHPIQPRIALLLVPLLLTMATSLGLGLGLVISAVTVKFRDFSFLMAFAIQLLLYTSAVICPLSAVPGKWIVLLRLNPMANVIEAFRYACLGSGGCPVASLFYSGVFSITLLLSGLILFKKAQQNFVENH